MAAALAACRGPERESVERESSPAPETTTPRTLPSDALDALAAATARILPSDDGPGAREAHVVDFIDRQLATAELTSLAPLVLGGARLLDRWARATHQLRFAQLDDAKKDGALEALGRGQLPVDKAVAAFPQSGFFRLLHTLTLEGFLSDPSHGGNADGAGWRYIHFGPHHHG